MKTIKLLGLALIVLSAGLMQSCEEKPEVKGKVDFSISLSEDDMKKSVNEDGESDIIAPDFGWHLLVSIYSVDGSVVMEDEIIPLYGFGSGYVSEKIELKVGEYFLEKFMVIGPYGDVIYAAPLEGSPKAHLVNDPLPIEFMVHPEQVSHVSPEVLLVGNSNPGEFGYASFSFSVVKPIVAYVMAVDDNGLTMRPSVAVEAVLSLYARDGWMHDYKLRAGVNKILVKSGYEYFKVIVENPDYPPYEGEIKARELMNSSEDNPVIFNLSQEPMHMLVLQPGPERGKDAMITDLNPDKNFGNHPYFEASFMTEPVLTVMRTKRSLIHFNMEGLPKSARIKKVHLTLAFETMIWDSLNTELDWFMIPEQQLVLQQIVEPWKEEGVTWGNQPETIEANQVFIPVYDEMNSNFRTYDVTSLYVPYQEIAAPNYGMMLRTVDYTDYPGGWKFVSSDYKREEMRPKLTVYYSLP